MAAQVKDKILTLEVLGQCPSGKNSVIVCRNGHRFPNKRFVVWRDPNILHIKKQLPANFKTISYPVKIDVFYYASDNRRRDVPGILDAIWHLLEKAGVVEDDKYLAGHEREMWFRNMGLDKENTRVVLKIYL